MDMALREWIHPTREQGVVPGGEQFGQAVRDAPDSLEIPNPIVLPIRPPLAKALRVEANGLVEECAYEQWHRMLFARFLAENGVGLR